MSYSLNYGRNGFDFEKVRKQFSNINEVGFYLTKIQSMLTFQLAVDVGDMYGDNVGMGVSLKKNGDILR